MLAVSCGTATLADPVARLETILPWTHPADWFGGLSGIEVTAGGTMLHVITDRGHAFTAKMGRHPDGQLQSLAIINHHPIRYGNGLQVKGPFRDAEGLAIAPDGQAHLTFERKHRATRFDLATGITALLTPHQDFAQFSKNRGFEALAVTPQGTLIALPEDTLTRNADFPIYAYNGTTWNITGHLPRRGPFLPVGADITSDGTLTLLERAASPLGFRSRIRQFTPPFGQAQERTLLTTRPGQFDNLEGLSIWRDATGQTRVTLVSDDNFLAAQRTQIVEFTIHEKLAPQPVSP